MCEDGFGHFYAVYFFHAFFVDVAGSVAFVQGVGDSFFYGVGGFVFVQGVAEEHGGGEDGGYRVGYAFSCDVRGGAVDGFVEAGFLAYAGRGEHTYGSGEYGGFVGEDVTEHVACDYYVEEGRVDGELLGAVVYVHVVEFDVGVFFVMDADDGAAPEAGCGEDVGFVYAGDVVLSFSGCFEGKSCDAFDFGDGVVFEVPCSFVAVMDFGFAAVAEVDAADEFSDDHDVGAFGDFGFQRRVVDHGVGDADGTEVDVESELFPKAQDGFFGTEVGCEVVPLVSSYGAEEDGVGFAAGFDGFFGKRESCVVVGGAACFFPFELEADFIDFIDFLEDADGFFRDFLPYPVARDDCDFLCHHFFSFT